MHKIKNIYQKLCYIYSKLFKGKVIIKAPGDLEQVKTVLSKQSSSSSIQENEEEDEIDITKLDKKQQEFLNKQQKVKTSKTTAELQCLTTMFGKKFNDKNKTIWDISSVDENKLLKIIKQQQTQIFEYHQKNFSRIYPAGFRFDSSNYDPIPGFSSGAQVVALNFQNNDLPLLLNISKFQINGGINSGYILKPKYMLIQKNEEEINEKQEQQQFNEVQQKISLKLIAGQELRKNKIASQDILDPYVVIYVKGLQIDEEKNQKFKSKIIDDNGFHPIFDMDCQFQIHCPEQAMIVFEIYDFNHGKDQLVAWYSIQVTCMNEGYRLVPLRNTQLEFYKVSCLLTLVKIQKTKYFENESETINKIY